MKKLMFFAFASTIVFASCAKEEVCQMKKVGTLRAVCTSKNPYDIWIDNVYRQEMPSNSNADVELSEGSHEIKWKQVSGFLLYPTEGKSAFTISSCNSQTVTFP